MQRRSEGATSAQIAAELGLTKNQVLGIVDRATGRRAARDAKAAAPKPPAEEAPGVVTIRRYKDKIAALEQLLKETARAEISNDEAREILGTIGSAPIEPPVWLEKPDKGSGLPEVLMTMWTDWHNGEVVRAAEIYGHNSFSPEICESRAEKLVDKTIHLARDHGPKKIDGAVINLGGDLVSGGLHEELRKTDAFPSIPAVLHTTGLLVAGLRRMRQAFGRIYVPAVCGNHGRITHRPESKNYNWQNWDWLIYNLIARELRDDSDIIIQIAETTDTLYRVYGHNYALTHGDMLGVKGGDGIIGSIGPIMRGEIKTRAQQTSLGRGYDTLLMGHWHQMLWLPRAIVAGSLKGYDEYAAKFLRAPPAPPSQPLWFHHPRHGITSRWEIKLETPALLEPKAWVSWPGVTPNP